ncbi:ABC transporter permease [Haloferax sp. AB510]|uniref:ABC transporter permease n=1 Tax=unclassified Haloferax TaxID=2625095 RepID=UPI0009E51AA7|nr:MULTISPECIES: ABC transporter permease [unclassified Haloferax]MCO8265409.1 ABC transporter permease [Haloferax sp. AB510]
MATKQEEETPFARMNEQLSSVVRRYKKTRLGKYSLLAPTVFIVLALMVFPTFILISFSLNPFDQGVIQNGLTLANYLEVFETPLYQSIIFRTIKLATIVTVIDFALGFPLAYAAVRKGGWVGKVIIISTLAPLTIDLVVRSFGWYILLNKSGVVITMLEAIGLVSGDTAPKLLFNEVGIIIGLSHVMLPFMVFPIINVMHTIPREYEEAALNLGANRLTIFAKILFPLALPGISAGVLITFVVSLASYVTPAMLGGGVKVLPIVITNTFTSTSNWPFASALSIVLVAIALLIIVGYQRTLKRMDSVGGS